MLLFFDVLALIAAIYTVLLLVDLWDAVATGKQGIEQDTSTGFGFIGLVVPGVHLLVLFKSKFKLEDKILNILSVAILVLFIFIAFITNYFVANHFRENGYVVCGYTERSGYRKFPYWMPVELCKEKILNKAD